MLHRELITRSQIIRNNFIGYILPDGKFLNLLENGFQTHWHYEQYLINTKTLEKPKNMYCRQITNLNQWIRVNDGTHVAYEVLAELPIKGCTEEQYKSLLEFIDYLRAKCKTKIDIGIEEHSRGVHFTDKSLWFDTFDLTKFTNKEIEYFIRDAYRIFEEYK